LRDKQDACTMVIRGVKRADTHHLPAADGDFYQGVELHYPLQEWSDAQVFNYLRCAGVKPSRIYEHLNRGLDCATCPAWWSERRGAYLKEHHPALFALYDRRLQQIINEVAPVLAELRREAGVR